MKARNQMCQNLDRTLETLAGDITDPLMSARVRTLAQAAGTLIRSNAAQARALSQMQRENINLRDDLAFLRKAKTAAE